MKLLSLTLTTDAVGHLDLSMLSDQQLVDLLLADFSEETKQAYPRTDRGDFVEVCEMKCIKCDSYERVVGINFYEQGTGNHLEGTFPFEFLPPCTKKVSLFNTQACTGTLNTAVLPSGLEYFDIYTNEFFGTIDMRSLPQELTRFHIANNSFGDTLDLTALPEKIKDIDVSRNHFIGSISIEMLPPELSSLRISSNRLSGGLPLESLPPKMSFFCADGNRFTGSLSLQELPSSMTELKLSDNKFSGELNLEKLPKRIRKIEVHRNQLQGSFTLNASKKHEEGKQHLPSLGYVGVAENMLSGTASVPLVFREMVWLKGNTITDVVDEYGDSYECFRDKNGNIEKFRADYRQRGKIPRR